MEEYIKIKLIYTLNGFNVSVFIFIFVVLILLLPIQTQLGIILSVHCFETLNGNKLRLKSL